VEIRAEFDKHRNESDPTAVKKILADAEAKLVAKIHPDPYISAKFPGGTGWERNLPPPPNAFTRYELDGHHHEDHQPEAVEDLDVLTEFSQRTGGARLSPRARNALAALAVGYQNQKTYAEILDDRSHLDEQTGEPRVGPDGKAIPSQLQSMVDMGREQGYDLSELETDTEGRPVSKLSPEQTKSFLKDINEGSLYDSLNIHATGVLEQEVSDARDAKDGIIGR